MKNVLSRRTTCSLARSLTIGIWWFLAISGASEQIPAAEPTTNRYALLIGCTKYPYCEKVRELYGPVNDIPSFSKLLETKFGFRRDNIQTLVGWPDDAAARAAHDNIAAAFNNLVAKAEEGSQVVVLISGHGTQVPDDDGDEIDGQDEVFLPADVRPWSKDNLPNAIRDDQFSKWFDALRQKGVHVWAVFDCCHSATMTRGPDDGERMRTVDPEVDLSIPASPNKKVAGRVALPQRALDLTTTSTKGSLTEFYASQAFEEAPELPRPSDVARDRRNYYGLFTYTLVQVLQQRGGALSYSDLSREIVNGYRSERGSKPPTPFFAGDLNRDVLGLAFLPKHADIRLQHEMGKFHIDAGGIHGITRGSILAVTAGNPNQKEAETLGYVRVTEVTPASSLIESCEYEGKSVVALEKLPKDAHCRVVMRDVGDMRVKIALRSSKEAAAAKLNEIADEALKKLPAEIQSLVDRTANEEAAEWYLHVVTPAEAQKFYQRKLDAPAVVLVKAVQQSGDPGSQSKVRSTYLAEAIRADKQVGTLSEQLATDLQKVFTWQNIWRVAGRAGSPAESDLKLEVTRHSAATREAALEDPNVYHTGDKVSIALTNEGIEDWRITMLHLDPHYGIDIWAEQSVGARRQLRKSAKINDKSFGAEGIVLLATPLARQKQNTNYTSLAQTVLGDYTRSRGNGERPATPFFRLMAGASIGKATRGVEPDTQDQPQVFMRSWLTLPEVKKLK